MSLVCSYSCDRRNLGSTLVLWLFVCMLDTEGGIDVDVDVMWWATY